MMSFSARSAKRRIAFNAVANWLGTVTQMVTVFFVSPILVHGLGNQRYGVWALVDSILAYLTLFDLGIGSAVVRYIARFESEADLKSINRTFSVSLALFSLAGVGVLLMAGLILGPVWDHVPVPSQFRTEAWWQLCILSINLAVGLPMGVFGAVLDGLQRFAPKSILRIITQLVRSILMVLLVWHGHGLMMLASTVTIITFIEYLIIAIMAFRYLPGLRLCLRLVNWDAVRMIGGYSFDVFVAMLAGRISFQTDAIVIGSFLPLNQITFFALPARLCDYARSPLISLTLVLTPHISQLEGKEDYEGIRRIYLKGTRYILWLIIPFQLGIFFLGKAFFRLWIGPEHAEHCFPVLMILATPLTLLMMQSMAGRILYGIGKTRYFSRMVFWESLVNLCLSLVLVVPMGISGVALGTALPNMIVNLAVVYFTCSQLNIGLSTYLQKSLILPMLAGVVPALIWVFLCSAYPVTTWLGFFVVGITGTAAYVAIGLGLELCLPHLLDRIACSGLRQILSRVA